MKVFKRQTLNWKLWVMAVIAFLLIVNGTILPVGLTSLSACQLVTPYVCFCVPVVETITVNVPEVRANACGSGAGINFGFHFLV